MPGAATCRARSKRRLPSRETRPAAVRIARGAADDRRVFLSLNVRVGRRLYDARPTMRALRGPTERYRAGYRGIRAAMQTAIDTYAARAAAIFEAVPALLETVDD